MKLNASMQQMLVHESSVTDTNNTLSSCLSTDTLASLCDEQVLDFLRNKTRNNGILDVTISYLTSLARYAHLKW